MARLEAGAKREDLKLADFMRKLVKFGLDAYEGTGSLHVLRDWDVAHLRQALEMEQALYKNAKSPSDEKKKPRTGTSG